MTEKASSWTLPKKIKIKKDHALFVNQATLAWNISLWAWVLLPTTKWMVDIA